MKQIHTDNAPAAIGPYSQAIEANGFIFASGQLPIDPQTGAFAEGGIKGQTRQSLLNAQSILRAAGAELSNVVKTTVFLDSMDDFAAMNEVYAEFCRVGQDAPEGRPRGDRGHRSQVKRLNRIGGAGQDDSPAAAMIAISYPPC